MQKMPITSQQVVVRIIDLDVTHPIDFLTPVENLGGSRKLFIQMLKRLDGKAMLGYISTIAESMNEQDWEKMKNGSHQLKGASGYVGAGRVYYCCYHIQKAFLQKDFQRMVDYYPLFTESCIEYTRFSRKYLASLKSANYTEKESVR